MAILITSRGDFHDQVPLQTEHDQDGEKECNQGNRADLRDEMAMVPLLTPQIYTDETRQRPGNERNAQVDEDALGELSHAYLDETPLRPKNGGRTVMKNQA